LKATKLPHNQNFSEPSTIFQRKLLRCRVQTYLIFVDTRIIRHITVH